METHTLPGTGIDRHYGMDWLRIGAFALLILYHIGMFFVPWGWHVKAQPVVEWATIPMLFTNGWRLALLFLVSGFASAAMLAKRPALGAFVRNRTARLLIPLAFGMIVVVPAQPWIELIGKYGYAHGFLHFWREDYFRFGVLHGIVLPTWQHLWFVAYLWPYTLALALLLCLPSRLRGAIGALFDRGFGHAPVLLLVPIGWIMLRAFWLWPGIEDTHALFDDAPAHWIYFPAFLFGFALLRARRTWSAIGRSWGIALALALLAYAVVAALEWRYPGDTVAPALAMKVFVAARAVNAWAMIVALLGIADRYWNRDHRWRAMLNEGVFPFYIVHQTIIVVVAWYCLRAGLGNGASFLVLVAATTLGCWLFYRVGREIPGLRLLIGLRGWHIAPSPKRGDAASMRPCQN